jgi:hypothetical protein
MECDVFQIDVVIERVGCKKHKNYGLSVVKCNLMYAVYFLKYVPYVFCLACSTLTATLARCRSLLRTLGVAADGVVGELWFNQDSALVHSTWISGLFESHVLGTHHFTVW